MQPELTGYTDRWSVAPGQTIRFMVSTDADAYDAAIIRLIQADNNPAGPGVKTQALSAPVNRRYPGRKQVARAGSYVEIDDHGALSGLTSFTFTAWIYPTLPGTGQPQTIVSQWAANQGVAVTLDANGGLSLSLGDGQVDHLATRQPLHTHTWYFVAASYDAAARRAYLFQQPVTPIPRPEFQPLSVEQSARQPVFPAAPLYIAAAVAGDRVFNGKIDRPRLFSRSLFAADLVRLRLGAAPESLSGVVADWDFAADIQSTKVTDRGAYALHGVAINMPMRGVTGYNWTGREVDYRLAPAEYGAIHFHDDDLDDARWQPDFELTIPADWKSGVYAARLTAGDQVDEIPFVVRPPKGQPSAEIAYLLPTMTYLAYANYRSKESSHDEHGEMRQPLTQPLETYMGEHPEFSKSLYDLHTDGSGFCYSSRMRPVINMRPSYRWALVGGPRHFAADLYLEDWLEAKAFAHDVIIDEDLHFDGLELLAPYKVIITGTHPEYWTTPMLDALQAYLAQGGRLMYLGGNGFYWVTSVDPGKAHVAEVRRGIAGTRAWESAPGELYHSTTAELGGLWRYRGRAPNRIGGIGFTSQGWEGRAPGYTRKPDSFDPRAAFIFAVIAPDEVIGNFGLVLGGAAGDELDRVDAGLGTPPHTLVLALSSGYMDEVLPVIEDYNSIHMGLMKQEKWEVHADIVYGETPNDGAYFSTGSITWCASLSHNGYDNNVSRVTENVLRQFLR